MRKARFTDEQMVAIIREADREAVPAVAKRHGISEQTIYTWRKRFGGFQADNVRRLKQLEEPKRRAVAHPLGTAARDLLLQAKHLFVAARGTQGTPFPFTRTIGAHRTDEDMASAGTALWGGRSRGRNWRNPDERPLRGVPQGCRIFRATSSAAIARPHRGEFSSRMARQTLTKVNPRATGRSGRAGCG
jgi:putative transposase